ncbi:MAG: hypothetical protein ACYYNF_02560 [Actinomycetes bacterium]
MTPQKGTPDLRSMGISVQRVVHTYDTMSVVDESVFRLDEE